MRILPASAGAGQYFNSLDDLQSFDPTGDDVDVPRNRERDRVFETRFTVSDSRTGSPNEIRLETLEPFNNQVFCSNINQNNLRTSIPLNIIGISSRNDFSNIEIESVELLSRNVPGNFITGELSDLNFDEENRESTLLTLDQNQLSALLSVDRPRYELELVLRYGVDAETIPLETRLRTETERISFYIANCVEGEMMRREKREDSGSDLSTLE